MVEKGRPAGTPGFVLPRDSRGWLWPELLLVTAGFAVAIVVICFALARRDCAQVSRAELAPIVRAR